MGIKAKYTITDVKKITNEFYNNVLKSIYLNLERAAIEVVNDAKNSETYADQTGNLRSSIGFVIFYNGEAVSSGGFGGGALSPNENGVKGSGTEGTSTGEKFALEVGKKYSRGFAVVIVAGMDYAAYVEAKGYDVITGSSFLLAPIFEKNLKIIKDETGLDFLRV